MESPRFVTHFAADPHAFMKDRVANFILNSAADTVNEHSDIHERVERIATAKNAFIPKEYDEKGSFTVGDKRWKGRPVMEKGFGVYVTKSLKLRKQAKVGWFTPGVEFKIAEECSILENYEKPWIPLNDIDFTDAGYFPGGWENFEETLLKLGVDPVKDIRLSLLEMHGAAYHKKMENDSSVNTARARIANRTLTPVLKELA